MALLKSKTLPNGVSGNYWKITEFHINKMSLKAHYIIELFKDSSFSNIKPLDIKKGFTFSILQNQLNSDLISIGYNKIKEYANSVVVTEVQYEAAIPATYDENNNELTPEIAEVPYRAPIYRDEDLQGAIDV